MNITANTRISELIRSNKDCIEAIASLAKPFARLRNPIMRKLMAPRVSIAEAAKMGGCSVNDFFQVLKPLGFESGSEAHNPPVSGPENEKPEWMKNTETSNIRYFDVRGILNEGRDPLKQILTELRSLEAGQILCIINSFIPTPLIRLLEKEQRRCYTEERLPGEYLTYFYKEEKKSSLNNYSAGNILMENQQDFEHSCSRFAETNIVTADVRMLEMPQPMQAILTLLPKLKENQALYVYHKKIPLYLLEALSDEQWIIHILKIADHDIRLLIHK